MGGPYFDELRVGQVFDGAPAMTLSSGVAAQHQAILGDRLRLPLDAHLSETVVGSQSALAHPGLVCDVAIGQSTLVTELNQRFRERLPHQLECVPTFRPDRTREAPRQK